MCYLLVICLRTRLNLLFHVYFIVDCHVVCAHFAGYRFLKSQISGCEYKSPPIFKAILVFLKVRLILEHFQYMFIQHPVLFLLITIYTQNKIGYNTAPCFTPLFMENVSDRTLFQRTFAFCFSNITNNSLMYTGGTPFLSSFQNRALCLIRPKALDRYITHAYTSDPFL